MTAYRPIVIAKAAELSALQIIGSSLGEDFQPVLVVPARAWNYDDDDYAKSLDEHYAGFPGAFEKNVSEVSFFVDISLVDSDDQVFGVHPLRWLVDESHARGLRATPVVAPESSSQHVAAVNDLHRSSGRGVAIRLQPEAWPSVDPSALQRLLDALVATEAEIDLFLEVGEAGGPIAERAAITEVNAVASARSFRSLSVGVSAFPSLAGVPRGLSEFPRTDLEVFLVVRNGVSVEVGFADTAVQRADQVDVGVDPKLLTISASLRYTTAKQWIIAKGGLFKAPGGRSKGGKALPPALDLLVTHPEYRTPFGTETDDWIDEVRAGSATPGSPQTWRKWGTLRHLRITASQLAR